MRRGAHAPRSESIGYSHSFRRVFAAVCLIGGLALMLYPVLGTFLNSRSFTDAVGHYEEQTAALSEEQCREMLAAAHVYNDSLRGDPVHDPFIANSGWAQPTGYEEVLNVDGSGLMGVIEIPAIGVRLPIRHGTSDEVLSHGAGHIPQTSLPVGGAGTHTVITGHTGLPTARLFDDLAQLRIGDVFIVEVLGEERAYTVDDVSVVEPDEVEAIRIDESHDYVTLMTCTPYGINSHRLLVRGEPCELPTNEARETMYRPTSIDMLLTAVVISCGLVVLYWYIRVYRYRRDDTCNP